MAKYLGMLWGHSLCVGGGTGNEVRSLHKITIARIHPRVAVARSSYTTKDMMRFIHEDLKSYYVIPWKMGQQNELDLYIEQKKKKKENLEESILFWHENLIIREWPDFDHMSYG